MLQKPNDSVPNFKMMNDAAIALADNECRAAFVTECIHKIETEIERVCQRQKSVKNYFYKQRDSERIFYGKLS